jgi:TRAP-type C4-dicarboxylate transport system permease small subunit
VHALANRVAWLLALIGGAVLCCMIAITFLSVAGRALNTFGFVPFIVNYLPPVSSFLQLFGPINGDYELVEAGMAVAIVAFLPWCSMIRGHATVDVFTSAFPARTNRFIDLLWEVLMTIVLGVITWRLFAGAADKMRNGETTFLLQFPVWWGYAICGVLAIVAVLVSAWMVAVRFAEWRGHPIAPAVSVRVDH